MSRLKLLITGAGGLLGSRVAELAVERGFDVYSTYLSHVPPAGQAIKLNVSDRGQVLKVVSNIHPDVIVHCAALTNVDLCEEDKDLALRVNVDGTRNIAEAAKLVNAFLIYISTDYVFDGEKGLYKEDDAPNPINFYGYSKLLGEEIVKDMDIEFSILRASVLYGSRPAGGKTNFALWILSNLSSNREIKVLIDQYTSPTFNTNLAEVILECCERRLTGLYHAAGSSRVSRYEFAVELAKTFGLDVSLIKKIKMSDIAWKARRPRDSSLDVSKAMAAFKVKLMSLREALSRLREELKYA